MKKIIAFVLLFSCLLTFGAGAKDVNLNFLDVKSASCTSEMTIVIDKPLEILSVLDENGYLDSVNKFIDLRAFIESLADSKIKCDIKVNTSDDNLKGRLAAEFDIFSLSFLILLFSGKSLISPMLCFLLLFFKDDFFLL